MPAMRVTGPVLRTERRQGKAKATGNAYDFTEVSVLVGMRDLATFTADDYRAYSKGDLVDLLVDVSIYNGRISCSVVSEWDPAAEGALLTA